MTAHAPATPTSKAGRNNALDVLRGLAILIVMFNHLQYPAAVLQNSSSVTKVLVNLVLLIKRGGWIGVDMFFVLSGFLVSGLLFKEYELRKRVNFKQFLIRRGFKLYPSFWVFLILAFGVWLACSHFQLLSAHGMDELGISSKWYRVAADGVFLSNYTGGQWPHVWSLCVEEHFYLLLTLLFYWLVKSNRLNYKTIRNSYFIILAFCVLTRIIAAWVAHGFEFDPQNIYTNSRLDALFMGVFLAYIYHFESYRLVPVIKRKGLWLTLSLLYLSISFMFEHMGNLWMSFFSNSIHPLCFSIILIVALHTNWALFKSKFLSYVGRISYAVYLWHFFVNVYVLAIFPSVLQSPVYWLSYVAGYMLLSVVFGVVFTRIVEDPFLHLRNKYFPSNAGKRTDHLLYPDDARALAHAGAAGHGSS